MTIDTTTLHAPASLRAEHEELHRDLSRMMRQPGELGEAARAITKVVHRHFLKEEQLVFAPLAVLAQVAEGKIPDEAAEALELIERLKAELPQMIAEHREVVAELDRLVAAGVSAGDSGSVELANRLKLHAQNEEEILYPAAIILGEYLKLLAFR
ncbi:MAG: hemerythrin domain-containing protein [Gemmatimonadetes bacterium]|nr:hemerythrin domain-containing protein [Gemmatimonadota bacterium]